MTEDMRVNGGQGQENNASCQDMKSHPFHGQILALSEIGIKKEIKKVKNRNSMPIFRKCKRVNSTGGLFVRLARGRPRSKEVKKDENGLKLERSIIDSVILV